jgi:hypothetical protein
MILIFVTAIVIIGLAYLFNEYLTARDMGMRLYGRSFSSPDLLMGNICDCFRSRRKKSSAEKPTSPPQPARADGGNEIIAEFEEKLRVRDLKPIRRESKLPGLKPPINHLKCSFLGLPADVEELCDRVWFVDDDPDEIFVTGFNVEIKRHDLLTLCPGQWLNDEVINFYLNLIMERSEQRMDLPKVGFKAFFDLTPFQVYAFNTFFFKKLCGKTGYAGVRRWTKSVNIFDYDLVLVPLHLEIHWCLVVSLFSSFQLIT